MFRNIDQQTRLARLILAAGLPLLLGAMSATAAAGKPVTLSVEVQGSLQGAKNDELSRIFATEMAQARTAEFQFVPSGIDAPHAPDRVEWSLVPGSDAAGDVRTFGFSRAMMGRLFGSHRIIRIEGRVFLNNAYQGMVSGQIRDIGDPRSAEIVSEVAELTRELLSPAVVGTVSDHSDLGLSSTETPS